MSKDTSNIKSTGQFGLPGSAGQRSYTGLPTIVANINGVPVRAFGRMFVYGVSPDFETGVVLQEGNTSQQVKMVPKASWELEDNGIGSMVSWQPRMPVNEVLPFLAINLIDGDPVTCWCSRGQAQADVEPAWIRIDLAVEAMLREIVLVPRKDGQGVPGKLSIKISRDAWHWSTVYEKAEVPPYPGPGQSLRFPLPEPAPVKQIWISGENLPRTSPSFQPPASDIWSEHCFSLSGIQAIDEHGENVALAARGAGVTVSSTNYGQGSTWDMQDMLWPVQYDLGTKWMRLSGSNPPYHNDTLQWRFVEQERGKYHIDERTDQAMTEAVANGCQIIVILCYGNWLYTGQPETESFDLHRFPPPAPPAPATREGFEGYKNWVRFMVRHFKGRVAWWEIWNEPWGFGWEVVKDMDERVKVYCDLVKEVSPIIREEDPGAKVSLAGLGIPYTYGMHNGGYNVPHPWIEDCVTKYGVAPYIDALGWHCQGAFWDPDGEAYRRYPERVRKFKQVAESMGFRGLYMSTENWWGAPYPPHSNWTFLQLNPLTEVRKAKDMARAFLMHLGLGVMPFWCNTWFDCWQNDGGLFRNTFGADPQSPTQPEVAYYVLRTLCTVMAGAKPARLQVSFAQAPGTIDSYSFATTRDGLLVAAWLPGRSLDRHPGLKTDIVVEGVQCGKITGIDTLNGWEQELQFEQGDGKVIIPHIIVHDYPLLLRLETK